VEEEPTTEMTIDIERKGDRCIIRLKGEFRSGADIGYLRAKFEGIKALGPREIVADLSGVSSMGSSGIGFIVGLYTSITKKPGGRFVMAGANPRVKEVFAVTNVDTVIPSADTVESALAALAG
jgi:anti-anti-sigma factor